MQISEAQIDAALEAFNDFPCPENGSICRGWNREQMTAVIAAASQQTAQPKAAMTEAQQHGMRTCINGGAA